MTSGVTGSRRLRLPLDQMMSMCSSSKSTSAARSLRTSHVRSPHECISVKNAAACHRHGEAICSAVAAPKNASMSQRLSRNGCGRQIGAFHRPVRT